jgi:hypothetical protein
MAKRVPFVRARILGGVEAQKLRAAYARVSSASQEFAVSAEEAVKDGRCDDAQTFALQMSEEIGSLRGYGSILVEELKTLRNQRGRVGSRPELDRQVIEIGEMFDEVRSGIEDSREARDFIVKSIQSRCACQVRSGASPRRPGSFSIPPPAFTMNDQEDEDEG